MGWNAGGYGTMRFVSKAGLDAWRAAMIAHEAWDDWPGELAHATAPSETVARRLAAMAKRRTADFPIEEVRIDGLEVELTYDDGEDGFRETAGETAALVRAAERHGAKGTFWFLGTAGAERDFAYELELDGKRSRVAALKGKAIARAYGPGYAAFQARVEALFAKKNPAFRALVERMQTGEKPRSAGAKLHARVLAGLADLSDAQLAAIAKKFPSMVPSAKGLAQPRDVFSAENVRALLDMNEEMRAVALWALSKHAPEVALPLAFEALDGKKTSAPVACAALRVLGRARGNAFAQAFEHLSAALRANESVLHVAAAQGALMDLERSALAAALAKLLPKLANLKVNVWGAHPAMFVLKVIERRGLAGDLRQALALYAKRERAGYLKKAAEKLTRKARAPRKRSRANR